MPLPRPDGKVGPSNDVVLSFDPDTLCHALWGRVTSSACSAVVHRPARRECLQSCRPGQQKYLPRCDLRMPQCKLPTVPR